jgi:hypothetical protein
MDDTLPVRVREVNLGCRRYSVEGMRNVQELHAVSGVWQAQLAHDLPEDSGQLSGHHGRTCIGRRWSRLPAA